MTEPLVVQLMREFKRGLELDEQFQVAQMAARWYQVETALAGEIAALTEEIARLQAAGEKIGVSKLLKMERYKILMRETKKETKRYADWASMLIEGQQEAYGKQGMQHAVAAIQMSYREAGVVTGAFNRLPVEAVETMAGFVSDGTPLIKYLTQKVGVESAVGMSEALVRAIALGQNPRDTARAMVNGLSVGLQSALNTARTEQLRTYREMSRQQYAASGVVEGYMRLSARDERVCAACLMADNGEVLPVEQHFEEHNQGRCTTVPVVKGLPRLRWESGEAWFMRQGMETQRSILGPERFAAWEDGQFELNALVTRREDATWGNALVPTPVKELVGERPGG